MDRALLLVLLSVLLLVITFFWPWDDRVTTYPFVDVAGGVLKTLAPVIYPLGIVLLAIVVFRRAFSR